MTTEPPQASEASGTPAPLLITLDPRTLRRAMVVVLTAVTLWLVARWFFEAIGHFLFLLLLSWLLSMAMEPTVSKLVRRGVRRSYATGIVGGSAIALVVLMGVLFGSLFITQLAQLVQSLPTVLTDAVEWANRTFKLTLDPANLAKSLSLTPATVGTIASNLAGSVFGIVSSALTLLLDVFTVIVFSFYLASDGPRVRRTIGSWLPPSSQQVFVTVWEIATAKTGGYVVSKVALAGLSAAFHSAFFAVTGVPYWLPLGLLTGVFGQFVPVVGTYLGIIVPVLFVVFGSPVTAVWIVVFATVYQQVENYVFTPKISKRTMNVNSGISLAAVFIGASLWGTMGALIGIPLAAGVVAILDTYGHRHELVPELAAHPDDGGRDGEPVGDTAGDGGGDSDGGAAGGAAGGSSSRGTRR
jgi:predicted PurR-regulated permease PerM